MNKKFPLLLGIVALLALATLSQTNAFTLGFVQNRIYAATPVVNELWPAPNQHWAVSDGRNTFSFFVDTDGNIKYTVGDLSSAGPYNGPVTTFLNKNQMSLNLNDGFFALSDGVTMSTIGTTNFVPNGTMIYPKVFLFDAVWASGPNRMTVAELTDPFLSDNNGSAYFIPKYIFNSTAQYQTVTTPTIGTTYRLQVVNLPNGDAIIGASEYTGGATPYNAVVYYFFRGAQGGCTIDQVNSGNIATCAASLSYVSSVASADFEFEVEPAYANGNIYLVYGSNSFIQGVHNQVAVYSAPYNNGTNVANSLQHDTFLGTTRNSANKFNAMGDSKYLYVSGEDDNIFWVQTIEGSNMHADETFTVTEAGLVNTTAKRDIFTTTNFGSTGVHFYYDYISATTQLPTLGFAYSQNGGVTWSVVSNAANFTADSYNVAIPPALTGAPHPPWAYNNGVDWIIAVGRGPTMPYAEYIDGIVVTLPSQVFIVSTTTTNFRNAIDVVTVTATDSNFVNIPVDVTVNLVIMMIFVALPAGAIGTIGYFAGGGKFGTVFTLVGIVAGVVIGVVYNIWPFMPTIPVLFLAIIAAYWHGKDEASGVEQQAMQ
jgi:hypothetical protein